LTEENRIPIVVGVTGHRALRPEDRELLLEAVKRELGKLQGEVPHSPLLLLTSLAEGADLLCADAARDLGIPVAVVLPMEAGRFTAAFSEEDRKRFEEHCRAAKTVFVAPEAEEAPEAPGADWYYRQAGIYVSVHSHLLLALWDGGPPREQGCGTAEAVSFSLGGAYRPRRGLPLRSGENTSVLHIRAPRAAGGGQAGETRLLGNEGALREILRKTDELNRLAPEIGAGETLLPEKTDDDGQLSALEGVYSVSDALSLRCAKKYRRVLALLAAACTAVTAGFLLYDEAELTWMLLLCGAMLLFAWFCRRWAVKSDCHRGYIEYRVLAESLRTQAFLRYAGSPQEAAELFPRTQREECPWVLAALCALAAGPPPQKQRDIRACWAEGQRQYHEEAEKRSRRAMLRSDLVVRLALCASVALYVLALVFEVLFGGLFLPTAASPQLIGLWRTLLKVVLGLISASTLFIANYYGKQSLPRTVADHGKMKRFYAEVSGQLERFGQTEELLRTLAAEELVENGNWCSYQRDNTPDVNL
jgi:hypothetical protein